MSRIIEINNVAGWKMAQVCMAKADLREYLNYLYIDLGANTITGTDGHRMVRVENAFAPNDLSGQYLVRPQRLLPKSIVDATFDLDTGILSGHLKNGKVSEVLCAVGESLVAQYPNTDKVLAGAHKSNSEFRYLCFNPNMVSEICVAGGQDVCLISSTATKDMLLIQFPAEGLDDVTALLMSVTSKGFRALNTSTHNLEMNP